ncbi:MAG: hypothetical protein HQ582_05040 [Planctomycetes bacterium]|nr:hypothetical protein [Planctomycetota bacterium]
MYSTIHWFREQADGVAYPSINTIGDKCGVSWRTAQSSCTNLQQQRFIARRFGYGRQTYTYDILAKPAFRSDRKKNDGYIQLTQHELQNWRLPINTKIVYGCLKRLRAMSDAAGSAGRRPTGRELVAMAGVHADTLERALCLLADYKLVDFTSHIYGISHNLGEELFYQITSG